MLYNYEDSTLKEYNIQIDKKELKQVKFAIIHNCSYIEHCRGIFAKSMPYSDSKKCQIENLQQIGFSYRQENMGWPDTDYYEYTYDKYYFPNIVNIIDEILNGNEDKISDLFLEESKQYSIEKDKDKDNDIEILKKSIMLINEYIVLNDEKILNNAIFTLNSYKHQKLESPKKDVTDYYQRLKNCFILELVNIKSEEELIMIKNLFGDEWHSKIEQILNVEKQIKASVDNDTVKRLLK